MRHAALLALALAALVAGCGDESRPPPEAVRPPSEAVPPSSVQPNPQAGWRATAEAVCGDFEDRLDVVERPPDPSRFTELIDMTVPLARADVAQLRALEIPAAYAQAAANLASVLDVRIVALQALGEADAERDEGKAERAMDRGEAARERARGYAEVLGLEQCGRAGR